MPQDSGEGPWGAPQEAARPPRRRRQQRTVRGSSSSEVAAGEATQRGQGQTPRSIVASEAVSGAWDAALVPMTRARGRQCHSSAKSCREPQRRIGGSKRTVLHKRHSPRPARAPCRCEGGVTEWDRMPPTPGRETGSRWGNRPSTMCRPVIPAHPRTRELSNTRPPPAPRTQ